MERAARAASDWTTFVASDGNMSIGMRKSRTPQDTARDVVSAALTDPDDPDFLARTLFKLYHENYAMFSVVDQDRFWLEDFSEEGREDWRRIADGFRTALTGEGK